MVDSAVVQSIIWLGAADEPELTARCPDQPARRSSERRALGRPIMGPGERVVGQGELLQLGARARPGVVQDAGARAVVGDDLLGLAAGGHRTRGRVDDGRAPG